jgi:putative membrane protein
MNANMCNKPIYFELDEVESIAEEEATVVLDYQPPVILPADLELELEPEPLLPNTADSAWSVPNATNPLLHSWSIHSPWMWLATSLGLLLVLILLLDTYHLVLEQYNRSFFLGTLFLVVITGITTATAVLIWRSYQNIITLRMISALQQEGQQLMTSQGYGNAIYYINRVAHLYMERPTTKLRLEQFYQTIKDTYQDREVCALFSQQIMQEIDQQAYYIVTQRSKETALLIMISHVAWLDTLLTLWRNTRMIQEVAVLYGGRPSLLSSISLIKEVLQNLIYADVSEIAAENLAEILGGSMLSILSTQMAQGLGSSVLTARVGLRAMQVCRPLPFLAEEQPRLKEIRKEIIKSLKKVVATQEPPKDKTI